MRQPTKDELQETNSKLSAENDLLHIALSEVMAGNAKLVTQFTMEGTTFKFRLCAPLRANGGTLLVTSITGKQRPMHSVYLLDQAHIDARSRSGHSNYSSAYYVAVDKAMQERNKALQAA